MRKETKDTIIVELGEILKSYPHFYLVNCEGLDAKKTSDLRRKCFKNEIKLVMVKNTLLQKALERSETDYSGLYEALKGNTAVMFCNTANAPAKLLKEYKKEAIPALKAAYAEEMTFVGADQLEALAAIKSKNELIADVVAALEGQIQGVLGALDSGANTIHGVLDTIAEKGK